MAGNSGVRSWCPFLILVVSCFASVGLQYNFSECFWLSVHFVSCHLIFKLKMGDIRATDKNQLTTGKNQLTA